jgi:Zn-dependent M28 family amino/carboxypeptidase
MSARAHALRSTVLTVAIAACAAVAHGGDARAAPPPARPSPPPPPTLDITYRAAAERLIGAAMASDHAYLRLSQLCDGIGNRISGSTNLDRAIAWAAGAMREDGLDRVRLQPAMVPHWVRGEEHAEMVEPGPERLSILGLGKSVGTPPGGITAEVVVVGSFAEFDSLPAAAVQGKIVLWDVPFVNYGATVRYRGSGASRAAARGAVASFVRSVGPISLRTPHTGALNYADSVAKIPAAAVTIEDATMMHRLLARGQRVRVHLEMAAQTLPDVLSHNVIGEIRGREKPNEVVVVGGHIDSWDVGQGAQDDGGGCIISMEAVRLIKQLGLRPRRTVRVVLWTNEEYGTRGANAYADSLGLDVTNHVAAIESDGGVERLLGFNVGVRIGGTDSVDAAPNAAAVKKLAEIAPLLAGLGADKIQDGGGDADIGPLMRRGVPGISTRTTMEHYFDWHHTQSDMLDKVDPIELRKNVAALAVLLYVVADMPETLTPAAARLTAAARARANPERTSRR